MDIELLISDPSGNKLYMPVVEEGIEWSTERRSTPGKLTFKIINDGVIDFEEGSRVRLKVDGKEVFYGFVFTKRHDKNQIISVTAYDQLRYLNNKDTYVYENKTVAEFIQMIATDFNLKTGTLEDTKFKIASRVEDNTSLFDMIENALDLTLQNTREMFVMFDEFGKITLKNIASMRVGEESAYLLIDEETGENFEYSSSIDSDVYNKIKLSYDNEDTGKRDIYIAQDGTHMNEWGVLQYFDTLSKGENGQAKADALLKLYNKKSRNLKITNAIGDTRVRAGSLVVVSLALGDVNLKNFMLVEKVRHTFKLDQHVMDLTLRGGEFVG
ncbi:MAG: hydrolase [Lachnoanaerobaculum sp.]|uniref:XkdQ/YqbQ family protein n=1 Tax=Lachnoanaerobaculum sp. TaxID=2049030 RepID=UPI0025C0D55C|nr:hydrolase [Lachnoanaerobaculum sp.]MBS5882325.1 hydrolase [Lachnoanaerobaculum sp.]